MRLAVAMWSASSTLRGRPNLVPLARDAARLRAVRSLVSSRSYSASEPRTPIIILPAAVEESMPSVTDTNVTSRSVRAFTVSRMCRGISTESVEFPDHDRISLAHVGHQLGQTWAVVASARHGVGERLNDIGSRQCLVLLIKGLRHRGDAGVANACAAMLAMLGVGVTHKGNNTRCETTISETNF